MFILREIMKKKSMARALFNEELRNYSVAGTVLDVGGGKHQDYRELLKGGKEANMVTVDIDESRGNSTRVDFEKDRLPFADESMDNVLVFNVLEHIFNYNFLVGEMYRVLKKDSVLLGFVPFLVNYHPDPHDYFRYTKEALSKIFTASGFREVSVREVGRGPFAVNYNTVMLSFPVFVRVILFPFYYFADAVFLKLRSNIKARYPLGYLFILKK